MGSLKRQKASHFFWNNGPPKCDDDTWLYEALAPDVLLKCAQRVGVDITYAEMCNVLSTQHAFYGKYCTLWGIPLQQQKLQSSL